MRAKHGFSNLHMTTQQFADLVVQVLDEQNYFKIGEVAHPQDIAYAFSVVGETIGTALDWAIREDHSNRETAKKEEQIKRGYMEASNLKKAVLPEDDEIAPNISKVYSQNLPYL